MFHLKSIAFSAIIFLLCGSSIFAQETGSVGGQVADTVGAVIANATVIVVDAAGNEKTATTDERGNYTVAGLAPGKYIVRATASGFSLYENTEVTVTAGKVTDVAVEMTVANVDEQVDVDISNQITNDPENNQSATVLKEKDLESLPDDPDELEAALQALAGASAGPNGGQIYIDGFEGGRLPPKESIREIRINQNPFSAEYDRLGFGRIEILTKPGTDKFRGNAFFNFNDESLNSRNPFVANRAPSQTRFYGGNFSGPLIKSKASYFVDVSNREIDNGAAISAIILNPTTLNPFSFTQELSVPNHRFSISPRFDYAINEKNTLVARYSYTTTDVDNQGIGGFSLPSRAFTTSRLEHNLRLTETLIVNAKTVNETRFEYEFGKNQQIGDNSIPTVQVSDAFTAGGSQIGNSFSRDNSFDLQNYTTTSLGKNNQHAVKFGVRLRGVKLTDRSESNYGGLFTFTGVRDPNTGEILFSSIDQFAQNVAGNPDPRFNPSQFLITTGNPEAGVSRFDASGFITDDWRFSQKLTLSFGLRYENQTNIHDNLNFAPRFGFAYSPGAGGARQPKTVFRGGFGFFYDRFSENYTLNAARQNGINQLQYIVTDPTLLGAVVFAPDGTATNVPTAAQLAAIAPLSSTIRNVSDTLQAPTTYQGAIGVERQLPYKITLSAFYIWSRNVHLLRSRNVNAPFCPPGITCPSDQTAIQALRPDPTRGNIYQYESSGVFNQQQLIVNFRANVNKNISLFGNYRLGRAQSDTDSFGGFGGFGGGAGGFPAYSYNLSGEYGNAAFDIRHTFFIGGNINLPYEISVSPFVIVRSGSPFNITTGDDSNRDSLFLERPTFAALNARCAELGLTNDFCNTGGSDPNATIPRNYGRGPGFFNFSLNIGKNFGFGKTAGASAANRNTNRTGGDQAGGGGIPGAGGRPGGSGGGGQRSGGFGGGGNERKPYNLNLSVRFNNLFNTVNEGNPISSLSSPLFGQFNSTASGFGFGGGGGGGNSGNRRIELQMRFSF